LYDNLQKYSLPRAEAIFDIDYFKDRPDAFYELCKELWPTGDNYKPTKAHNFMTMLHEKGMLLRCYTQNIDMLEQLAGLPAEKIVAAHGNFASAHSLDGEEVPTEDLRRAVMEGPEGWKRLREQYGSLVKPDIVFFGESLPQRFSELSQKDFKACDLLIVMGTSLVVGPFNSLVARPAKTCPRVLVNREKVGIFASETSSNDDEHTLAGGFWFPPNEDAYRDVFLQEDCDEGAQKLCDALGWTAHLERTCKAKLPEVLPRDEDGLWVDVSDADAKAQPGSSRLFVCPEAFEDVLKGDWLEAAMPPEQAAEQRARMALARAKLERFLERAEYPGGLEAYVGVLRKAGERDDALLAQLSGADADLVATRREAVKRALLNMTVVYAGRGKLLPGETELPTPRSMPDLEPIPKEP